jgi:hypothetical protein
VRCKSQPLEQLAEPLFGPCFGSLEPAALGIDELLQGLELLAEPRPPLSTERLQLRPDGRLRLELKTPWADGTSAIVLAPLDLISRLCALVPPPRFNLTRFHGVLASAAKLRCEVVPQLPQPAHDEPAPPVQLPLFGTTHSLRPVNDSHDNQRYPAGRHPWAWLMKRVFQRDVSLCPRCQGPMTIREVALTADSITRVLARHGHGPQPPPTPPMSKWVDPTQGCLNFA